MKHKKLTIALLVLSVFVVYSTALSSVARDRANGLFRQLGLFADALAIIQTDYADEVKPKDLIYGALRGMLSALDPYSQFMDPQTYNELKVETRGSFGGIGIEIAIKDGLLTVITPIEGTPAWKAGVKTNDQIVKINSELTRDMALSDAVKRLRGIPGTAVKMTILREAEKKVLEFKFVRAMIKIKDIKEARILEDGIGYIRLVEFSENTPQDIDAALKRLRAGGMNSLILDLRNNPGGLLEVAVKIAERFIEKGRPIVYTKGRRPSQDLEFVSQWSRPVFNLPTVVLINEGSASGSEILAASLQDYKLAVILGTKSFGKGSVQTVIPLRDGSALRLTTSKYFSPLGREIQGSGVQPDIIVPGAANSEGKADWIFKQLSIEEKGKALGKDKARDYRCDNQLMRAIEFIKASGSMRIRSQG